MIYRMPKPSVLMKLFPTGVSVLGFLSLPESRIYFRVNSSSWILVRRFM